MPAAGGNPNARASSVESLHGRDLKQADEAERIDGATLPPFCITSRRCPVLPPVARRTDNSAHHATMPPAGLPGASSWARDHP
jgi:hypothetical protein